MNERDLYTRSLQQDISEVGAVLGETITAQTSQTAFDHIESVRTDSIAYRTGELDSRTPIWERLGEIDPETKATVARAFTTYFAITNLAEERERVRQLQDAQPEPITDSLEDAVAQLAESGTDATAVQQVLEDILIEPTFTAHPTEARRKTVKRKLSAVARLLTELDERRLTTRQREALLDRLEAHITTLWATALIRNRRPTVTDEAANVHWYLEHVLFDVLPHVYEELDRVLGEHFEADIDVPKLYEFRSWAGSDRDGNPYVTPEVTAETLDRQRTLVLGLYRDRLTRLVGELSQERSHLTVGPVFDERFDQLCESLPNTASDVESTYPDEPYRQFLTLVCERIERVGDVRPGGYRHVEAFVTDLEAVEKSLRANNAGNVADEYVVPLRWQARTFGFVLASLDLRDHRQEHTSAIAEALEGEGIDYRGMDEDERVEFLTDAVLQEEPVLDLTPFEGGPTETNRATATDLSAATQRVLTRFTHLADWQREYGVQAIDTYCISMCEEPSHALEVLFLADQADVIDLPDHAGLDIVPLLETEAALSDARRIMGTLFENEAYAQVLDVRENLQEIMLGYSDSNKENGFLAANWSLHVNQKRLAAIAEEFDVKLRLFHGRGGSISRGGGPMNDALLALPRETVTGQVKFTEQGEAIDEKYGNPRIAERNLEQMLHAQIRARYEALEHPSDDVPQEWQAAMETAASAAREAYRDLLETDGFVAYFEEVTPIRVIENLNMGSRPASRSGERTVESLRAIPWVFSWTQTRCILPGWYSLACGFEAYLDDGGDLDTLGEMYEKWPFFQTTLDNAALALARTDLEIAEHYTDLTTPELREQFFPQLQREYEAACDLVLDITGRDHLLRREWLRERLARRNSYVDPLNLLQVQLLGLDERTAHEDRTLRLTVKGIAAAMQNTG